MKAKSAFAFIRSAVRGFYYSAPIILTCSVMAATNDLSGLLQKGLFEEEANRNLDAASAAYETLVKQFDKDRQIGATAVFRLGEVYRKQGKTNEAAAQYERIVRDFAEQTTLVTLSRQNLAGLGVKRIDVMPTGNDAGRFALENRYLLLKLQLEQARNTDDAGVVARLLEDEPLAQQQKRVQEIWGNYATNRSNKTEAFQAFETLREARKELIQKREQELASLKRHLDQAQVRSEGDPAFGSYAPPTAIATAVDEEEAEIRRLQTLIQNSPDLINAPRERGYPPLAVAASKGQLRVAKFLLDNGALINQKSGMAGEATINEGTALHYAAAAGHRAMVELLLSRSADVNVRSKSGYTALHVAAQKGFQSVAEALVNGKADINAPANWRETPLRLAAENGHDEMTAFLIAKGADVNAPDGSGMTPLHWAASQGHRESLQHLLAAKAGLNGLDKDGQTALSLAAGARHLEIMTALLQAGADANAGKADPPVHSAIKARAADVVQALLKAGADANLAARVMGRLRYPDGAERALPTGDTVTPLALAMSMHQTDIARLLLTAKADPNGKRLDGVPLVFSALSDADLLQAFLDAGADPNAVDASRQPSATLLGRSWNPKMMRMLLATGAKPNVPSDGHAPLIWAANWEKRDTAKELAESLLAGGADVQVTVADGRTALHLAAQRQNRELAKVLLAFKADVNARDNQGLTPLDYALGRNRPQDGRSYPVTAPINRLHGDAADTGESSVAALLRQNGGLDNLPDLRTISVSRGASGYRETVFSLGTNDWSHYTLRELIAQQLRLLSTRPDGTWERRSDFRSGTWGQSPIRFPDFTRIVIHRPSPDGKNRTQIPVVFSVGPDAHGKRTDWQLERGDVVEIPEADHPVSESWAGPSAAELATWTNTLSRTVKIVIAGKASDVQLTPGAEVFTSSVPEKIILTPASFMVRSALDQSRLVRYSSDLTRVKVIRPKGAKGKRQEWVVDCSGADGQFPDLWLQDGDVIEVPDKP